MELDGINAAAVPAVEVELTMSNLEHEELVNGYLSTEKCAQLLLFYLIENDLLYAKFLWKRTPLDVKQQKDMSADLSSIWKVVLLLLKKDYINFYSMLKREWAAAIKPFVEKLRVAVQNRVLDLISRSYSSIKVDDLISIVDLTVDQTIALIREMGWSYEENSRMIEPIVTRKCCEPDLSSQRQLSCLSSYVSFLEN